MNILSLNMRSQGNDGQNSFRCESYILQYNVHVIVSSLIEVCNCCLSAIMQKNDFHQLLS